MAEQTDATEPEQAGWFCLQVNSRPADPKRYATTQHGGLFTYRIVVLSILLLAGVTLVSANHAQSPSADLTPRQTRSIRIQGTWRLHKSHRHSPDTDKWQLVINADGSATYTGNIPFLIEEKKDANSIGSPGGVVTRIDVQQGSINGQWDLSEQYLSIVTTEPSIHRFHVLAITADILVLEHDFGIASGQLFWARSGIAR